MLKFLLIITPKVRVILVIFRGKPQKNDADLSPIFGQFSFKHCQLLDGFRYFLSLHAKTDIFSPGYNIIVANASFLRKFFKD